jgi:hypothetical protein
VHTLYYRSAEAGISASLTENVGAYLFAGRPPLERADTAAKGLMEIAYGRTFDGLETWLPAYGREVGLALCAMGLILMAMSWPEAGAVVVLTLCASAPYSWTWPLGSGGDFRFTMHVVPIALIASVWVTRSMAAFFGREAVARASARRNLAMGMAGLALAAMLRFGLHSARLLVDGAEGRPLMLTGSPLDSFLVRGFGWPRWVSSQYVRSAAADPRLDLELQPNTPWLLTVRWWSASPLTVTEDGQVLGVLGPVDQSSLGFAQIPIPPAFRRSRTIRFEGRPELWWVRLAPDPARPPGGPSRQ